MNEYVPVQFIQDLKQRILSSRYLAAKMVNRELIKLYFNVGEALYRKIEEEKWGAKVLESISARLQQELPGLRGFSASNLRRMRKFYHYWENEVLICSTLSNKLKLEQDHDANSQNCDKVQSFLSISFSHHYEIVLAKFDMPDNWYYIEKSAQAFWSVRHLRKEIRAQSHLQSGNFPNNFKDVLEPSLTNQAIQSFKDEYLLDFINLEDPDDEPDEQILEHAIIRNMKKFMMSLGNEFAFIGNQYRLQVGGNDYFIDLLFYHRRLQAMIAFELKKGKFKPEYAGKMNFYLSALDDLVKLEHEHPSIGIILCKEKNNMVVEYSFRDVQKPMGVSVFKTSPTPPEAFKGALPGPETLKKLMDECKGEEPGI